MANCPSCGSDHIQLVNEVAGFNTVSSTNIESTTISKSVTLNTLISSSTKVLGLTSNFSNSKTNIKSQTNSNTKVLHDRYIYCLDCGNTWTNEELQQLINLLNNYDILQRKLDLQNEKDRQLLKDFIVFLENDIQDLEKQIKTAKKNCKLFLFSSFDEFNNDKIIDFETLKQRRSTVKVNDSSGIIFGCFVIPTFIFGLIALSFSFIFSIVLLLIAIILMLLGLSHQKDQKIPLDETNYRILKFVLTIISIDYPKMKQV